MGDSTVGKLIIEIASSVDELKKGMKQAESSVEDLQKATTKADRNQQSFQKDIDKTGSSAKTSSKSVDTFTDSVEDAGDETIKTDDTLQDLTKSLDSETKSAGKAADGTKSASKEIGKAGDESEISVGKILNLQDAFGKLAGAFSATAILSAIAEVITELEKLDTKVEESRRGMETLYQNTAISDELQAKVNAGSVELLRAGAGGTEETRKAVVLAVERNLGDLAEDIKFNFEKQVIYASGATGYNPTQLVDDIGTLMYEWGVDSSEAISFLNGILQTSTEMYGEVGANFSDLISGLKTAAPMFEGTSIEVGNLLNAAVALEDDQKNFSESMSLLESEWLKGAQETIQSAKETLADVTVELSEEDRAALQQIANMNPGELLMETINNPDSALYSVRNTYEMEQVANIIKDSFDLPVKEFSSEVVQSIPTSSEIGAANEEAWANYWAGVVNPSDLQKTLEAENDSLEETIREVIRENRVSSGLGDAKERFNITAAQTERSIYAGSATSEVAAAKYQEWLKGTLDSLDDYISSYIPSTTSQRWEIPSVQTLADSISDLDEGTKLYAETLTNIELPALDTSLAYSQDTADAMDYLKDTQEKSAAVINETLVPAVGNLNSAYDGTITKLEKIISLQEKAGM